MYIKELTYKKYMKTQENGNNTKTKVSSDSDVNPTVSNYALQLKETIEAMFDPTNGMSEDEKEKYRQKIMHKIENGKELTAEEMRYIKANMPELYPYVLKMQIQRKSLEENLKHCNSKEEANNLYDSAMSRVNPDEPLAQAVVAAYDDVMKEFKKSGEYSKLPEKEEDVDKKKSNLRQNKYVEMAKEDAQNRNIEQDSDVASGSEISSYFPEDSINFSSVELEA